MAPVEGRWLVHAACREGMGLAVPWLGGVRWILFDPEMWFPERGNSDQAAVAAKSVCAACPVRVDCLLDVLDRHEEFGVWGGAGEPARRALQAIGRSHDGYQPGCGCGRCVAVDEHFARLDGRAGGPLISFGSGARCGTAAKYGRGCHCLECKEAHRVAQKARRVRKRRESRGLAS